MMYNWVSSFECSDQIGACGCDQLRECFYCFFANGLFWVFEVCEEFLYGFFIFVQGVQ